VVSDGELAALAGRSVVGDRRHRVDRVCGGIDDRMA
jgi:hypothetical protein